MVTSLEATPVAASVEAATNSEPK
uniref:Uncharacterized protein n=1 Tax=Arundo donax TaxID=35708 RepID=A0A0A9DC68_ARUDO